jgi:hypothetical protein
MWQFHETSNFKLFLVNIFFHIKAYKNVNKIPKNFKIEKI